MMLYMLMKLKLQIRKEKTKLKIEKHNIIQCVGIVLLALILMIMGYTIKSKQEQIEALESANTSLQTYCSELKTANEELAYAITDIKENITNNKELEVLRVQSIIEPLKEIDKRAWFILYKSIQEEYDDYLDSSESIYDYFTDEQIVMMQKCIETETYQCSFEAKVNVACVIINRVEHDEYPTDPVEIITSKNQFAYSRNNITEDTILALEYAFMIEDTTDGCIAFRSDCSPDTWYNWTKQFTDESGHTFYK